MSPDAFALISMQVYFFSMQVIRTAEKQRYSRFLISLSQKYLFCQHVPLSSYCLYFCQSCYFVSKLAKKERKPECHFVLLYLIST